EGGHRGLLTADTGKGLVIGLQVREQLRRGLEEEAGPPLVARQPGAIAFRARLDAELDEVAVPHADPPQDLLEDAVLAVLRVGFLLERPQVAGLPPAVVVLDALEALDLVAESARPHQPKRPLGDRR